MAFHRDEGLLGRIPMGKARFNNGLHKPSACPDKIGGLRKYNDKGAIKHRALNTGLLHPGFSRRDSLGKPGDWKPATEDEGFSH